MSIHKLKWVCIFRLTVWLHSCMLSASVIFFGCSSTLHTWPLCHSYILCFYQWSKSVFPIIGQLLLPLWASAFLRDSAAAAGSSSCDVRRERQCCRLGSVLWHAPELLWVLFSKLCPSHLTALEIQRIMTVISLPPPCCTLFGLILVKKTALPRVLVTLDWGRKTEWEHVMDIN